MKSIIKRYKWQFIISSLLTLFPVVVGLILKDKLPTQMAIHWGPNGADAWASTMVAVLVLPLILLALHIALQFITLKITGAVEQNPKIVNLTFFLVPVISWFACGTMYATAFGKTDSLMTIPLLFFGLLFVVIGNLIPKAKRNFTMGIKVKWALANDENWTATHRFAGKLWVIGGLALIPLALLPVYVFFGVLLAVALAMGLLPTLYSYLFYKKQLREGKATEEDYVLDLPKGLKSTRKVSIVLVIVILIGCAFLMTTGEVKVSQGDTSFTLEMTYWQDQTFSYSDIESIEYRENDNVGIRINGFASARLLLGFFNNEEFGNYTRFSYTSAGSSIVMKINGSTVVISMKDAESTKALYSELLEKVD